MRSLRSHRESLPKPAAPAVAWCCAPKGGVASGAISAPEPGLDRSYALPQGESLVGDRTPAIRFSGNGEVGS